jgi:hypothetical protein
MCLFWQWPIILFLKILTSTSESSCIYTLPSLCVHKYLAIAAFKAINNVQYKHGVWQPRLFVPHQLLSRQQPRHVNVGTPNRHLAEASLGCASPCVVSPTFPYRDFVRLPSATFMILWQNHTHAEFWNLHANCGSVCGQPCFERAPVSEDVCATNSQSGQRRLTWLVFVDPVRTAQ